MKHKLINNNTREETLCDKITIDGFDYYVNDEKPIHKDWYISNGTLYQSGDSQHELNMPKWFGGKVIATNNPKIDVPKVVDKIQLMANEYGGDEINDDIYFSYISGYNKSQETHPFSEEDMIEFGQWVSHNDWVYLPSKKYWVNEEQEELEQKLTSKEIIQLWKEQKPKIVYYE